MSFVAKVFVVLNLVLSVGFLFFAMTEWTARTKWQKMYEHEKTINVPAVAEVQQLQRNLAAATVRAQRGEMAMMAERDEQKRAKEELRDKNLAIQTELAAKQSELTLTNAERQEEARENKRLLAEVEKNNKVMMKLQQAVMIEKNNAQAQKNIAADLESQLTQTQLALGAANRAMKTAQEEHDQSSNVIADLIRKGFDVYGFLGQSGPSGQPAIEAKVLAVKPEVGLIMLSVGENNGVKPGYRFMISKGSDFKGTVQVDKVYADMCSAKIVLPPKDPNMAIAAGDIATTSR